MSEPMSEPSGAPATPPLAPRPLTVAQLTARIRGMLEGLGRVAVEGEVSKVTYASSGHLYFDLKDIDAKIACAVWKSQLATALRAPLKEGDKVVVHGKLDVYGPRGGYTLLATRIEPAGVGALLAQLERLKQELKARGWLDRKRPIPPMPAKIAVVTSRDGAAFQDFLRTRSLRWPLYPVCLVHTPVQGAAAAAAVAAAIRRADQCGAEVIVVIRGGGSLEDLWAFNELAVAEAIWSAKAPVVSGVGHETDVTLCDLVADKRAHTPTDAAQCVIPDRAALAERLERAESYLVEAMAAAIEGRRERLDRAASSRALCDAAWILVERRERVEHLRRTLVQSSRRLGEELSARLADARRRLERRSPLHQLASRRSRVDVAAARLSPAMAAKLEALRQRSLALSGRLEALSPLAVLARGYSITFVRGRDEALRSIDGVAAGAELDTRLSDGRIVSTVSGVAGLEGRGGR
jgi:exodeoxyribonuclease VII large subunit